MDPTAIFGYLATAVVGLAGGLSTHLIKKQAAATQTVAVTADSASKDAATFKSILTEAVDVLITQYKTELKDLSAKVAELEARDVEKAKLIGALEQKDRDNSRKISDLERHEAEQAQFIEDLSSQVTRMEQENIALVRTNNDLTKQIGVLSKENVDLRASVANITKTK